MSIPLTNEEAGMESGIQANLSMMMASNPSDSWEDILAKLDDPNKDPFEKMFIVMYELMPAITTYKENELEELSGGLEQTAALTDTLTKAQTHFNNLKEASSATEARAYRDELKNLHDALLDDERSNWLDPELRSETTKTIQKMMDDYDSLGKDDAYKAEQIHTAIWSQNTNGDYSGTSGEMSLKGVLDDLNTAGTSFKNTSGVIQARFQFEVGNYETFVGIYKDMFKNWRNQLQSPLNGMRS